MAGDVPTSTHEVLDSTPARVAETPETEGWHGELHAEPVRLASDAATSEPTLEPPVETSKSSLRSTSNVCMLESTDVLGGGPPLGSSASRGVGDS